ARAIAARLDIDELRKTDPKARLPEAKDVNVDVIAFNSKVYYVITDGGGFGEQVRRFPVTGSETVLDAISNIAGLPAVASKKRIWGARRTPEQPEERPHPQVEDAAALVGCGTIPTPGSPTPH